MTDDRDKAHQAADRPAGAPASGPRVAGDDRIGFDCCGGRMEETMAQCPCASIVRRHPVITALVLSLMGLAALLIPAGAILGMVAFFRAG